MSLAKRSSHPSVAERMAIDADRLLNYRDKRYKLASDGSLRDSKGKFVNGTRTTGGFDQHPENRREGGGWDKRMTASYQYRRYWAMEKMEFMALGKRYRVIKLDNGETLDDYPYEEHTVVEENTLVAVLSSLDSLKYMHEITQRVEGRAVRMADR